MATGRLPGANGIPETTFDAKGDLIVGTGDNSYARVAVSSTSGYVLTSASTATAGVQWSTIDLSSAADITMTLMGAY